MIVEEHTEKNRPQEERACDGDPEARAELAGDRDQGNDEAEPEEHDRRAAERDADSGGPEDGDHHSAKRHGEAGDDPRALNPRRRPRIAHETPRYRLAGDEQREEDNPDRPEDQADGGVPFVNDPERE